MAFERFTRDARAAVVAAREEARTTGRHTVESEHLLLALAARPEFGLDRDQLADALALEEQRSLAAVGVDAAELEPRAAGRSRHEPRFATSSKLALQRAVATAAKRGDRRLTAGHVLLGVLAAEHGRVPRALRIAEVDVDRLRREI
ncbi:MAG TPA: Clp protease N-terminal domain-containing protein [Solirubrobacteraceae bacterium]|nr:Clp protease N-terminal domain-containing protein [Solirubrobacteraceae bacterium]